MRLFADNGYESTTVDQIAAAAGVARRTFFRYFATKEDAVFPDHEKTLAKVARVLGEATADDDPVTVVCRGIREVLRMYISDPDVSVARYRLLRQVPALRERENGVVSRYERLFTKFLLEHSASTAADDARAALLAEVSAAAVVATHNHVLRRWLRAGGNGDALTQLDDALDTTMATFVDRRGDRVPVTDRRHVVVAVSRTSVPPEEVVEAVRRALTEPAD